MIGFISRIRFLGAERANPLAAGAVFEEEPTGCTRCERVVFGKLQLWIAWLASLGRQHKQHRQWWKLVPRTEDDWTCLYDTL
jgi:hypothetical protein